MLKKIKNAVIVLTSVLTLGAPMLAPALVSAQTPVDTASPIGNGLCGGIDTATGTSDSCAGDTTAANNSLNNAIRTVINIFSIIVGAISVIMIIVGGFKYITSGGDSAKVTSAKNTLMYAIIGLIIVALAQIIVRFVLTKSTNPF